MAKDEMMSNNNYKKIIFYAIISLVIIICSSVFWHYYTDFGPVQTSVMIRNDANEHISGSISFGFDYGNTYSNDRYFFLKPKEEYIFDYNKPLDAFIRLDFKLNDMNYRHEHYIDVLGNATLYYEISNDGKVFSGTFYQDKTNIIPIDRYEYD